MFILFISPALLAYLKHECITLLCIKTNWFFWIIPEQQQISISKSMVQTFNISHGLLVPVPYFLANTEKVNCSASLLKPRMQKKIFTSCVTSELGEEIWSFSRFPSGGRWRGETPSLSIASQLWLYQHNEGLTQTVHV